MPRKRQEIGGKKRSSAVCSNEEEDVDVTSSPDMKLKIKLGKVTLGEKKLPKVRIDSHHALLMAPETEPDFVSKASNLDILDEESLLDVTQVEEDEEEAWLDALEKGDLDDSGGLKKVKDPSMMTARQRALKDRTSISSSKSFANVNLLGAAKPTLTMTEEAKKRKEEKNKRRKLQAVRKAEESQKQTIERLIKQQGSKMSKERQKKSGFPNGNITVASQPDAKVVAMIKYHSKGRSVTISFPEDIQCAMKAIGPRPTVARPPCAICGSAKKYSSSKTGAPLCSLQCFRLDLENHQKVDSLNTG